MKISIKKQFLFTIIIISLIFMSLEAVFRAYHLYHEGSRKTDKDSIYINRNKMGVVNREFKKRKFEAYPYVMYRTKPNQHLKTFNINSLGFRGEEIKKIKNNNCFRIIILGGSAAWGTGVTDEDTINAKLERKLNGLSEHINYEVINAGDSGYVSTQEFILLFDRIMELDPDLVITFDGFNDIYAGFTNHLAGFPQNFTEFKEKLENHNGLYFFWYGLRKILSHSILLEDLKTKLRTAFFIRNLSLDNEGIPTAYANISDVAGIYGRNLKYMYMLLNATGVKVLFTIQPALTVGSKHLTEEEKAILTKMNKEVIAYSKYVNKGYKLFVEELKQIQDEYGARTLDLTGIFDSIKDTIYIDDIHFSEYGSEIIAQRIFESIKKDLP